MGWAVNTTLAQTTPASSSTSATLQPTGIASNGMKFADMEKMSPEEMKSQPFAVRMEFKKWQKEQLDKAAIVRKNEEWKIDQAAIVRKNEEWKVDQEMVSLKGKVNDTNLIKTILQVNANWNSWQATSDLRRKLAESSSLQSNPILKDFCKDYIDGKCPPIQQQHLIAINTWLKTI
jgi:hypothetical protein